MNSSITPNIKKDNDPFSKWDTKEVNKELDHIDLTTRNLVNNLVTTNTDQVIESQKTFYALYPKDSQLKTYDSIMDELPFNISPVFGAANYHFLGDASPEEGQYTKPRPDGARMSIASLNPVYFPSEIKISTTKPNIATVSCSNIPIPKVNGINQLYDFNNDGPLYWETSISYEGSITIAPGSGTSSSIYIIYILYNKASNTSSLVYKDITSVSAIAFDNDSISVPVGFVVYNYTASSIFITSQSKGVIHFHTPITLDTLYSGLANSEVGRKIISNSIARIVTDDTSQVYHPETIEKILTSPNGATMQKYPSPYEYYLPLADIKGYNYTYFSSFPGTKVKDLNFGDLLSI